MNNKVLLIESDLAIAKVIRDVLAAEQDDPFDVECVRQLSEGLQRLNDGGIGTVLVDLSLADSQGIATFNKLFLAAPDVSILVLAENEEIAKQALQGGAIDYLSKAHLNSYSLPRLVRHVIRHKAVEQALFEERERAEVTLNSIGDAVVSTDLSGNVTYLNIVAERMTGWSRGEASGRPLIEVLQIVHGAAREPVADAMAAAIRQNRTVALPPNALLIRRDGLEVAIEDSAAPIHNWTGKTVGAVMVFHDVSAALAMESKMSHLAQHDYLTDLPNRLLFNDRLTQAITLARRHGKPLAVLFFDLDRFKNINDSLGHAIGDKLLQAVAKRLAACVRGSDTVSRRGGDEFVALLSEIEHPKDAALSAEKLLTALTLPYAVDKHDLHVTTSIGISIYPDDGAEAEILIQRADTAMYHAKENGRNNYQFFKRDMNIGAVERQSIEVGLRRALKRQEFILHYQPKINVSTGAIIGAEALIRWQHPERGLLPPAQFVPIAEECGLIVPIGRWVLREACTQFLAWRDAGLLLTPMAVNVSAAEFRHEGFVKNLRTILTDTGVEPCFLELELTESVLMQPGTWITAVLRKIKAMGVQLALDDFGTGYSSLSHLRGFPIDALKIDKSFVQDITSDPDDAAIISAVITMSKGLKKRVIAEGVETREQLAFLQAQRCGEAQGYYFSRPVSAAEFANLLKRGIPEIYAVMS